MKKLMIAAAIVCAAAMTQAANVTWKTGSGLTPYVLGEGESYTTKAFNSYVWIVDSYPAMDSIWSTYGNTVIADITGYTASVTGKSATLGGTVTWDGGVTPAEGQPDKVYHGVVITTYDGNKDGKVDYYCVNEVDSILNSAGTVIGGLNTALQVNGTGAAITWTAAAVPEPTSGLLLLLGVAGLALRRRRA